LFQSEIEWIFLYPPQIQKFTAFMNLKSLIFLNGNPFGKTLSKQKKNLFEKFDSGRSCILLEAKEFEKIFDDFEFRKDLKDHCLNI